MSDRLEELQAKHLTAIRRRDAAVRVWIACGEPDAGPELDALRTAEVAESAARQDMEARLELEEYFESVFDYREDEP